MKIKWIPTNEYYHDLLAETDPALRQDCYLELFVQPWQQMMCMVGRHGINGSDDPLAGAKGLNWLLPQQTAEIANLLETMGSADAWQAAHEGLIQSAAHFAPYTDHIPFNSSPQFRSK